jgi:hypothetical protein
MSTATRLPSFQLSIVATCCAILAGCEHSRPKQDDNEDRVGKPKSADYRLQPDDYDKFQFGRAYGDVLDDVQWRGNLEESGTIDGTEVSAISFGFYGGPHDDDPRATILWAIFVDGKFEKFVEWPTFEPRLAKLGDHPRLSASRKNPEVKLADIAKEPAGPRAPSQTDPGLTVAWLALKGPVEVAHKRAMARNTTLRDQFNASRLRLSTTPRRHFSANARHCCFSSLHASERFIPHAAKNCRRFLTGSTGIRAAIRRVTNVQVLMPGYRQPCRGVDFGRRHSRLLAINTISGLDLCETESTGRRRVQSVRQTIGIARIPPARNNSQRAPTKSCGNRGGLPLEPFPGFHSPAS